MRLDLTGARPRLDLADAALRLTPAQRQAMATDREILVTAGAGAGKTHTLSLRYVALLLELAAAAVAKDRLTPRPDIEAVLVLTFTEKAAEEMAERCYRRLLQLAEIVRGEPDGGPLDGRYGPGYGAGLAAALDHLVDSFEAARIGTFHGFCARLLREFPAECGAPAEFAVLDEPSAKVLQVQAVDAVLAERYEVDPERCTTLVAALGSHRNLRDALLACLGQRDVLGSILERHATGSFGVGELLEIFPVTPDRALDWLQDQGLPMVDELVALLRDHGGDVVHHTLVPLQRRLHGLLSDPEAFQVLIAYRDTVAAVLTQDGKGVRKLTHNTVMGLKAGWPSAARAAAIERLSELQVQVDGWLELAVQARGLPGHADPAMLAALEVLGDLFVRARQHYRAGLVREGALDFSALQGRAVRAVLGDAGLRRRLIHRHRYLMVDEFQDTDLSQWQMVHALGRPDGTPSDRIFVVGDVKQAIYRFRGGDVTVFDTAARTLGVSPLVLPDNFRSRPALIDWFNHFFHRLLGPPRADRPAYEAPYQSLAAGRATPGGSVVLATHDGADAESSAIAEADGVARLIAASILPGTGDFADLGAADRRRHPTPPIAILLRARTRLPLFEAALREHGVPFMVAKGVGFWRRDEVRDVVNVVHGIATHDPISLTGALRSPLFGLSDQDLQDLVDGHFGLPPQGHALVELGRYPLDDLAPARILAATATLQRLRRLRHRLPVSGFVREVLRCTLAQHAVALTDENGQGAANLERLVELAATFDGRGALGLDHAVQTFIEHIENDQDASEAPVSPSAARVLLLTVHASKGLEFPVVIVPQCGVSPPSPSTAWGIGRLDSTWHVATKALDPSAAVRSRVETGLLGLIRQRALAEERAESRRLLYVAATRARDHLVLVGTRPTRPESGKLPEPTSWSQLIGTVHGPDAADGQRVLDVDVPRWGLEAGVHDGLRIVELDDWRALQPPAGRVAAPQADPTPEDVARIQALPARDEVEVSPSSLDAFSDDPVRWYRRHRLGVPDDSPRSQVLGVQLASARGEVIHSLLEDDLADDTAVAVRRWRARAAADGATPDEVEAALPELLRHLRHAADDPRVAHRLAATGMDEVKFRLAHAGVVLTGQIDRLWLDVDAGGWVVLDWKSERIRDGVQAAAQRHARQLAAYAWAADRILRAHGQPGVVRAELYFTDVAALVELGPLTSEHLDAVASDLEAVGRVAALDWGQVCESPIIAPPSRPLPLVIGASRATPAVATTPQIVAVPYPDMDVPHSDDDVPYPDEDVPYPDEDVPYPDDEAPYPDDEAPYPDDEAPYPDDDVPLVSETHPAWPDADGDGPSQPPEAPLSAPEAALSAPEAALSAPEVPLSEASLSTPEEPLSAAPATGAPKADRWGALRDLLGLGPAATGHTPVPPKERQPASSPPEPPPADLSAYTAPAAPPHATTEGDPEPATPDTAPPWLDETTGGDIDTDWFQPAEPTADPRPDRPRAASRRRSESTAPPEQLTLFQAPRPPTLEP